MQLRAARPTGQQQHTHTPNTHLNDVGVAVECSEVDGPEIVRVGPSGVRVGASVDQHAADLGEAAVSGPLEWGLVPESIVRVDVLKAQHGSFQNVLDARGVTTLRLRKSGQGWENGDVNEDECSKSTSIVACYAVSGTWHAVWSFHRVICDVKRMGYN